MSLFVSNKDDMRTAIKGIALFLRWLLEEAKEEEKEEAEDEDDDDDDKIEPNNTLLLATFPNVSESVHIVFVNHADDSNVLQCCVKWRTRL